MSFTRDNLSALRTDIMKALETIPGVKFSLGSLRFTPTEARATLTIDKLPEDGSTPEPKMVTEFKARSTWYGIPKEALGTTFSYDGTEYILEGLLKRSRKYPFACRSKASGKLYKFTSGQVKRSLKTESK